MFQTRHFRYQASWPSASPGVASKVQDIPRAVPVSAGTPEQGVSRRNSARGFASFGPVVSLCRRMASMTGRRTSSSTPSTSCDTSVCRTPSGQPPAVQIGNPADLASLASPPSSHDRAPISPVTTVCSSDEVGGESLRPASGRRDTPSSCLLVLSHSTARLSEHPLPHQSRALGLGIGELPLQDFEGVGPESGSSPANGARRIG